MNDLIREKLQTLPENSGVYIMYDKDGAIIYVGKAVVLKNRVRQYFHAGVKAEKVRRMVEAAADFNYILTPTELDALALESNLIKKHRPKFNILLKDDKARPYIKIDFKRNFPNLEITRRLKKDGARYFGPFFGGINAKDLVELIKAAYPVRTCKLDLDKKAPKNRRECLNYHMGYCLAPCTGKAAPDGYRAVLERVAAFLNGKDKDIEEVLRGKMAAAAAREEFETALVCRDRLAVLEKLKSKTVAALPKNIDLDALAYATDDSYSVISVLSVRGGKMMGCENFPIIDASLTVYQALSAFIPQYYAGRKPPAEILLPQEPEESGALAEWLNQTYAGFGRTELAVPKAGVKRRLLETADENARDFLVKSVDDIKRKQDFTLGAVDKLQRELGLRRAPLRIECYDISNISGTDQVASMVVFVNGSASKKEYRRFKIRTVEGSDDFASMKEVLSRRLLRDKSGDERFALPPDLLVIDGGKGQLSSAFAAMRTLGLDYEMISLAKREEEVFLPGESDPRILSKRGNALKLLQRVRDEAHRFAITYHRKLRTKRFEKGLGK
ncbi:MAG: excinuclease ABC subunit UvrC [Clostridiales bacterium]|jgi:excinuclease ABC subunit C|nr:excinuclease ABC subunit UvrC [Clostridiales bacterium]